MKKFLLLAFAVFLCLGPTAVQAATDAAAPAKAAPQTQTQATSAKQGTSETPASPAATLAPIANQLGQTLQTLVGVSSTQPGQSTPDATGDDATAQAPIADTFASALLGTLLQTLESIRTSNKSLAANGAAFEDFSDWLDTQTSDPRRIALWQSIGHDLLLIVGIPLLCGVAATLLLVPLRQNLRRKTPETFGLRLAALAGLFGARILPAFVFLGASLLLLEQNEPHNLPRFVIMNVIYAVTAIFTLYQAIRCLFAPNTEALRLIPLTTPQAIYGHRWTAALTITVAIGYFTVDVANALRIPTTAVILFQNLLGLALTAMAIAVILALRPRVAAILRGKGESDGTPSVTHSLRMGLAHHWHALAIAYLVIGLTIAILGIENGLGLMLRGTVFTVAIFLATRASFVALDRWTAPTQGSPALIHRQGLGFIMRPLIWVVAATAIAAVWGLHVAAVMSLPMGQKAVNAFASVVVTLVVLTALYELLNAAIERHLGRRDKETKLPLASARARTLLPMVRTSVFVLFSAIIVITILSAVGVNIGPLLAGAGVLGVALGFGSQTLVKDFLTGLFIVIENIVAVGDIVKIGEFSGVVEALSIRTLRLRDQDGALHILPFSEVSKITNMTKGFAFALVNISVAYDTDLERAMQVMREVGADMQDDPVFKRVILEPIEVMGVEDLGDSSITIRARMRTRPGKQWDVRRNLLLRIKQRFDKENIEIPFPVVTHINKAG